jgi:hypothetical protein
VPVCSDVCQPDSLSVRLSARLCISKSLHQRADCLSVYHRATTAKLVLRAHLNRASVCPSEQGAGADATTLYMPKSLTEVYGNHNKSSHPDRKPFSEYAFSPAFLRWEGPELVPRELAVVTQDAAKGSFALEASQGTRALAVHFQRVSCEPCLCACSRPALWVHAAGRGVVVSWAWPRNRAPSVTDALVSPARTLVRVYTRFPLGCGASAAAVRGGAHSTPVAACHQVNSTAGVAVGQWVRVVMRELGAADLGFLEYLYQRQDNETAGRDADFSLLHRFAPGMPDWAEHEAFANCRWSARRGRLLPRGRGVECRCATLRVKCVKFVKCQRIFPARGRGVECSVSHSCAHADLRPTWRCSTSWRG